MANPLEEFLASAQDSLLLTVSPSPEAAALPVLTTSDGPPAPGKRSRVGVRVRDRQELRSVVVPDGIRSAHVAIWLDTATAALAPAARPDWPDLLLVRSRRLPEGGSLLVLRFERPVPLAALVAEVGRQAVWPDRAGNRGLFLHSPAAEGDDERVPPDVVLPQWLPHSADPASATIEPGPVTGRAPVVLRDVAGPLALGRLDERVLNPIGFDATADGPVTDLASADLRDGPTERLVAELRSAYAVGVELGEQADIGQLRTVAGLAMAGVPLTTPAVPPSSAQLLGEKLSEAMTAPLDTTDLLAREEHSIVLRRAALDTFASYAWASALAEQAGTRVAPQPAVTVVLATRRPEQLKFALDQVARQRGVERLELVLAAHGFRAEPATVRAALGDRVAVQVADHPDDMPFGDVLQRGVEAAGGDVVVKMDDDDWYGPDAVADLLRGRAYSGAELVGMPPEFHYLVPLDVTVKRGHPAELYSNFVAGGTLMIDRGLLRQIGGFRRVRKFVDASLLVGVTAAGGATYRIHGLGYVLRRNASGHTWEVDMDYLLDPVRVQRRWDGFTPSRLMEL